MIKPLTDDFLKQIDESFGAIEIGRTKITLIVRELLARRAAMREMVKFYRQLHGDFSDPYFTDRYGYANIVAKLLARAKEIDG